LEEIEKEEYSIKKSAKCNNNPLTQLFSPKEKYPASSSAFYDVSESF